MAAVIGWDIGGAHVKAARAEDGRLAAVVQLACAPHESLARLEHALRAARAALGEAERHRVTMTAELSDAFETRARGVIDRRHRRARNRRPDILFYAGATGFVARAGRAACDAVASANWRASAELAARHCADALFIDIGSTTTDLSPIRDGVSPRSARATPSASLMENSPTLGISRGAPQAYAARAPVAGRWTPLVNEAFASMADVRRVLGDLPRAKPRPIYGDGRWPREDSRRARAPRAARWTRRGE